MFGSLQKWNKCFFATLKIYSLNHLWVGQYPQGLLTPHRTIQKIKLYFWEFCPNISWTPMGIALVETKLCPLDCATTTKLQQRLGRQGLLHKSFYAWSTEGNPKDRTCMVWPFVFWTQSVPLMGVFPEIHSYSTCISGLWSTSKAGVIRNSECSMSWAELLPQSGCQSSGISRQIFKILKLYLHRISGKKRGCVKVEVQYLVAFHTVPVKNSMAFCVKS